MMANIAGIGNVEEQSFTQRMLYTKIPVINGRNLQIRGDCIDSAKNPLGRLRAA